MIVLSIDCCEDKGEIRLANVWIDHGYVLENQEYIHLVNDSLYHNEDDIEVLFDKRFEDTVVVKGEARDLEIRLYVFSIKDKADVYVELEVLDLEFGSYAYADRIELKDGYNEYEVQLNDETNLLVTVNG